MPDDIGTSLIHPQDKNIAVPAQNPLLFQEPTNKSPHQGEIFCAAGKLERRLAHAWIITNRNGLKNRLENVPPQEHSLFS